MGEFDKYKGMQSEDMFYSDADQPEQENMPVSEPEADDEFVIGGGFNIGEDYEGKARLNQGRDKPPVIKQRPLSDRSGVDLHRLNREDKREQKRNGKKNSGLKTIIWIAAILVVSVVLALGIIAGFTELFGIGKDNTCVVMVEKGMSTSQIAELLEEEGAIEHPFMFRMYLKLKKQDGTLRHGAYQFNASLGYEGIVSVLQKGNEKETVTVRIPEGATVQTICSILEENNVCTAEQFKAAMKKDEYKYEFVKAIPTDKVYYRLEGYLYPDTYDFFTGQTQENAVFAIDRMLANFESKLLKECPDYKDRIKELSEYGIDDLNDVMSLASIVQLECNGFESEMSNVSAVFLGRLVWSEPRYLGSTPTFYYPDNRYNTNNYKLYDTDGNLISEAGYEGLPPGPQCSVTVDAINAVLDPNTEYIGKFYYFVTDSNSKFYYNKTYKQHKNTINELVRKGLWAG